MKAIESAKKNYCGIDVSGDILDVCYQTGRQYGVVQVCQQHRRF